MAARKTICVEDSLTKIAIYSSWAKMGTKSTPNFADQILINPKVVATISKSVDSEKRRVPLFTKTGIEVPLFTKMGI